MNIITSVIGRSGMGKSTSIRTLDPTKTIIVSTDNKPLPFKGGNKFSVKYIPSNDPTSIFSVLDEIATDKTKPIVVLDAFTQWSENLMYYANRVRKGYDRQNLYNDTVLLLWNRLPEMQDKAVFVFSHPALESTIDGEDLVVGRVENKQRKGIVEEKATITLMAKSRRDKETGQAEYFFETQSDGKTAGKSPIGMFNTFEIPNDLKFVLDSINNYYSGNEETKNTKV